MNPETTPPPEAAETLLNRLHRQVMQPGRLDKKTKELIALAVAQATGEPVSMAYHLHNALEAGAAHDEVEEALDVAVVTLGEPAALRRRQLHRALAEGHAALAREA